MNNLAAKKFGIGSLSLIFSILGIACSFTYPNYSDKSVGAIVLNYFGIHGMTGIVTILMLILSVVIGIKYSDNIGAKAGYKLSAVVIVLIAVLSVINMVK